MKNSWGLKAAGIGALFGAAAVTGVFWDSDQLSEELVSTGRDCETLYDITAIGAFMGPAYVIDRAIKKNQCLRGQGKLSTPRPDPYAFMDYRV